MVVPFRRRQLRQRAAAGATAGRIQPHAGLVPGEAEHLLAAGDLSRQCKLISCFFHPSTKGPCKPLFIIKTSHMSHLFPTSRDLWSKVSNFDILACGRISKCRICAAQCHIRSALSSIRWMLLPARWSRLTIFITSVRKRLYDQQLSRRCSATLPGATT